MPSHLIVTGVIKILLHYAGFNQAALRLKSLRNTTVKASNNTENTYTTIRLPLLLILKLILMQRSKSFMLANFLLELYLILSYIINVNKLGNYYEMNIRKSYMTFSKS